MCTTDTSNEYPKNKFWYDTSNEYPKNSILVGTQIFQKLGGRFEKKSTNHPSLAYGEARKYEDTGLEMYLVDF